MDKLRWAALQQPPIMATDHQEAQNLVALIGCVEKGCSQQGVRLQYLPQRSHLKHVWIVPSHELPCGQKWHLTGKDLFLRNSLPHYDFIPDSGFAELVLTLTGSSPHIPAFHSSHELHVCE